MRGRVALAVSMAVIATLTVMGVPAPRVLAAGTTTPSAPTGLSSSTNDAAGSATIAWSPPPSDGGSATIAWSPPTSDGGSPVTGYRVARDGTDTTGYGAWSSVISASSRSFTF